MTQSLRIILAVACMAAAYPAAGAETNRPAGQESYVFAHYMTWFETPEFSQSWKHWEWKSESHARDPERILPSGHRDIASLYHPLIGPYDSTDDDVLEYHILLAKAAGIDGFVVNWYGFTNEKGEPRQEDKGFRRLIAVADRLGFLVCLDLDDKSMFRPYQRVDSRQESVELTVKVLREALAVYGKQPAYFRLDGRPVLTNFGWDLPAKVGARAVSFSPEEWGRILSGLPLPKPVFIANYHWHWNQAVSESEFAGVADSLYPWVADQDELRRRFYREAYAAKEAGKIRFVSAVAYPGFDSFGTWGWGSGRSIISREDGALYERTLQEALDSRARWIQIVTWNDFAEGTNIEPTYEYGYRYLELTADAVARLRPAFRRGNLTLPRELYDMKQKLRKVRGRQADVSPALLAANERLAERATRLLAAGEYSQASEVLNELREALNKINVRQAQTLQVDLDPKNAAVLAGGQPRSFVVTVANNGDEPYDGRLFVDGGAEVPAHWFDNVAFELHVEPGQTNEYPFTLKVPEDVHGRTAMLEAKFFCGRQRYCSAVAFVEIHNSLTHINLGPRHVLRLQRKEKVAVQLLTYRARPDHGTLRLEVPEGWLVSPEVQDYQLPPTGKSAVEFTVTPLNRKSGKIKAVITSQHQEDYSVDQSFEVIGPGDVVLVKKDINHDGIPDYVLGNAQLEAHVTTGMGGRILALYLGETGHNQLYLDYPSFEHMIGGGTAKWVEYGGINDTFPYAWPGTVWNNTWNASIIAGRERKTLKMTTRAGNLILERDLTLDGGSARLAARYTIENAGDHDQRVVWNNHPDLCPGPAERAHTRHQLLVPVQEGLMQEPFTPSETKRNVEPAKGWCVALDTGSGEYIAQRFPKDLTEGLGLWKGKNFFTMEILMKPFLLEAGKRRRFTVEYEVGKGNWLQAFSGAD